MATRKTVQLGALGLATVQDLADDFASPARTQASPGGHGTVMLYVRQGSHPRWLREDVECEQPGTASMTWGRLSVQSGTPAPTAVGIQGEARTAMYRMRAGGRELDASFEIDVPTPTTLEITLDSAGGTTGTSSSRNPDYTQALELILERLCRLAATLNDGLLASRIALNLPDAERRVTPSAPFTYPIQLDAVQDFAKLRLALTTPQASIASSGIRQGGGNQRKKVTLYLSTTRGPLTETSVADALEAFPVTASKGSRRDIAVGLVREDIELALAKWREIGRDAFHRTFETARAAKFVIVDDSDTYDAKAILYAARVLKGWADGRNADFYGDRTAVAEPLVQMGYTVEELARLRSETQAPVGPSDYTREELIDHLNADETRLGQVYRGLEEGLTADQIAKSLGVATPNFVWNYSAIVAALLDGVLPSAPTVALQVARKFRKMISSSALSAETLEYLQANLVLLERVSDNAVSLKEEEEKALRQTEAAERIKSPGVYVYALPHYLRYPYDPQSGRSLLKVGSSENSTIQRFLDQTRTTALPEEPVLLRIYPCDDPRDVEKRFHSLLTAFDHSKAIERTAGKEWFLTTLGHLDAVASLLQLPINVVTDLGGDE